MNLKRIWVLSLFPVALFPSGISPVKRKDKGLVTTAEAAVGGLYRSFCELGANDQERI